MSRGTAKDPLVTLHMLIPESMKQSLAREAEENNCSITDIVTELIQKDLKRRRVLTCSR
jgi:hypothetical protein